MGSVVTFLAYIEFPNTILIKHPNIGRIILIFPDSPDIPPLAKCAAPRSSIWNCQQMPSVSPGNMPLSNLPPRDKACTGNHLRDRHGNLSLPPQQILLIPTHKYRMGCHGYSSTKIMGWSLGHNAMSNTPSGVLVP